jgi:hypothetical protein
MSNNLLDGFKRQEAESIASSVKLHRWSMVMIELLVWEQEQKLLASDLPVDEERQDNFWEELA